MNAETVGLAFFDDSITDEEKTKMVEKLSAGSEAESSDHSRNINPKLQKHQVKEFVQEGVSAIVSKETMNFFEQLDINPAFLQEPSSSWQDNMLYKAGLTKVKALKVVNDVAERGVKLITDFNTLLTKDEEQRQITSSF